MLKINQDRIFCQWVAMTPAIRLSTCTFENITSSTTRISFPPAHLSWSELQSLLLGRSMDQEAHEITNKYRISMTKSYVFIYI